jgi:signal transduction histidine kinase
VAFESLRSIRNPSFKIRLSLITALLVFIAASFAGIILYLQHRVSIDSADRSVRQYQTVGQAMQLKETLSDIERSSTQSAVSPERLAIFDNLLAEMRTQEVAPEDVELLRQVDTRYRSYEEFLQGMSHSRADVTEARIRYDDVAAAVEAIIVSKQNAIYQVAHEVREKQKSTIRLALILLGLFLVILLAAGTRIVTVVTRPLSALADYLDEFNVEDDLPARLPAIPGRVPEIVRLSESFQQLLRRLRGYQKLNVKRLLIEKRRADIIAASISDGIFLLRNEEVLYVNPVGERILGLPGGKSWKGMNLRQAASQAQAALTALRERSRAESQPFDPLEAGAGRGIQAIFQAITRTMPIELEIQVDGRKQYYLLQSYPISEEVIEQVEHSFDGPVDQLLDRWQSNVLVMARDVTLVKESQQAKSHFIATLSHEVKTPVTSLTMAIRLLKRSIEQIPNPTHQALVQTCAEDIDRLRGLIDDLLSVSRFDTLTQKLEVKDVDIAKLLRQSVQHFQLMATERGVSIGLELPAERRPVVLSIDAAKISWAISNLVINAMRHTPRGGRVEARVSLQGDQVEIHIRDHGPGIDKSRQDRLFDKFNPFYDIRVARSGSIGMGLAIAREIIVAHGGRIWVISEPGQGAEFCFTLPLRRPQAARAPEGLTTSSISTTSNSVPDSANSGGNTSG